MNPSPAPRLEFDWGVYADATFAGLSILIPVPFLDSAFEWLFRRRMPPAIAQWRGRRLSPAVTAELNQSDETCLRACLLLPVTLTLQLVKRLSKKLLYFLTLKEASDRLSYYWHRAFLLDHMLIAGHLNDLASAQLARQALDETLVPDVTSPLQQLARQIVPSAHHVLRSLRRARLGVEDDVIQQIKAMMQETWESFGDYLAALAARYDEHYAAALAERRPATSGEQQP